MRPSFLTPAPDDTRALKRAFGPNLKFGCDVSCLYFAREVVLYPLIDVGFELGADFWAGPRSVFDEPPSVDPFLRDTRIAIRRALPGGALTDRQFGDRIKRLSANAAATPQRTAVKFQNDATGCA